MGNTFYCCFYTSLPNVLQKILDCTSEPKWCWVLLHNPASTRKATKNLFFVKLQVTQIHRHNGGLENDNGYVHSFYLLFCDYGKWRVETFRWTMNPPEQIDVYMQSTPPQKLNRTPQKNWGLQYKCPFSKAWCYSLMFSLHHSFSGCIYWFRTTPTPKDWHLIFSGSRPLVCAGVSCDLLILRFFWDGPTLSGKPAKIWARNRDAMKGTRPKKINHYKSPDFPTKLQIVYIYIL